MDERDCLAIHAAVFVAQGPEVDRTSIEDKAGQLGVMSFACGYRCVLALESPTSFPAAAGF